MDTSAIQSDESSDGFSLVDDEGDSLVGSEVHYMESEIGSVSTPSGGAGPATEGPDERLTPEADRAVCRGKWLLLLTIAAATVAASLVLRESLQASQEEAFEAAFVNQATLLSSTWKGRFEQQLESLQALGASITSYTTSVNNNMWPNVTVPDFDQRITGLTSLAQSVMLLPTVTDQTRAGWESYSMDHLDWMSSESQQRLLQETVDGVVSDTIFRFEGGVKVPEDGPPPFSPVWQHSPVDPRLINFNLGSHTQLGPGVDAALESNQSVLSETITDGVLWSDTLPTFSLLYPLFDQFGDSRQSVGLVSSASPWNTFFSDSQLPSSLVVVVENSCAQIFSFLVEGDDVVYRGVGDSHEPGFASFEQSYDLSGLEYNGEDLLLNDPTVCDYILRLYPTSKMHDEYHTNESTSAVVAVVVVGCAFLVVFLIFDCLVRRRQEEVSREAIRSRKIVASLFPAVVHDRLFQNSDPNQVSELPEYQRALAEIAPILEENNLAAIATPLANGGHPKGKADTDVKTSSRSMRAEPPMQRLRTFLSDLPAQSEHSSQLADSRDEPIADLFPNSTVMFADISGFTAWSSVREPSQVFKLLETIYRSFDSVAKKRAVFKVETIGDCYVAVTGLPDPQEDHALIMSRFAKECMQKMKELTRKLEVSLGPETGDLCMRFGLHSGPVTAGVLRGEKSRFQLFGDTVNFASRMESTGQRNRIQVSQATADLIIASGKQAWVQPREDLVNAKGKGQVQTYWVVPRSGSGSTKSLGDNSGCSIKQPDRNSSIVQLKSKRKGTSLKRESSEHETNLDNSEDKFSTSRRSLMSMSQHSQIWSVDDKIDIDDGYDGFDDANRQERLIEWNVEILAGLLKRIVVNRDADDQNGNAKDLVMENYEGQNALEEVTEIIPLSSNHTNSVASEVDPDSIFLKIKVEAQLKEYVTMIACMYRDNFFHSFEHASHVLMSAQKLLKRVVSADQERSAEGDESLDDYTSVIAHDPLTQFAIVFCALIHDVDHTGVPNSQLVKENAHIAQLYNDKSIAEQNSLDLAWDLLMDRRYRDLQRCIFANQDELKRFRQLVVNVVLATDIFDPDMKSIRHSRWEKAFHKESLESSLSEEDDKNLKATIVTEYIMQASDVSHTMQHWHIYQRWNARLFEEMYSAYQVNRGEKDPSLGWYKGELWFFDNYIIPMARKLQECQVFGAASDECLKYALENRKEWEAKGEEIVRSFVEQHEK